MWRAPPGSPIGATGPMKLGVRSPLPLIEHSITASDEAKVGAVAIARLRLCLLSTEPHIDTRLAPTSTAPATMRIHPMMRSLRCCSGERTASIIGPTRPRPSHL